VSLNLLTAAFFRSKCISVRFCGACDHHASQSKRSTPAENQRHRSLLRYPDLSDPRWNHRSRQCSRPPLFVPLRVQGPRFFALSRGLHAAFDEAASLFSTSLAKDENRIVSRDGMFQAIAERTPEARKINAQSQDTARLQAEDIHRLSAMDAELETLRETAGEGGSCCEV
jgi:hypothetical protein